MRPPWIALITILTIMLTLGLVSTLNASSVMSEPVQPVGPALGPSAVDVPPIGLELIGQLGGSSQAVAVSGTLAYLGSGSRLIVLNISDPSHPVYVGQTRILSGTVVDVGLKGKYAYVLNGSTLHVIDVSTPAKPVIVGLYDTGATLTDMAVSDGYAYLADRNNGLRVIDVTNPAAPSQIATAFYPFKTFNTITVAGSYVYLGYSFGGVFIFNVTNPASPQRVGGFYYTHTNEPEVTEIYLVDNRAYVGFADYFDDIYGMYIYDATDPVHLSQISYISTATAVEDIAVKDGVAYVACAYRGGGGGLDIIDVSVSMTPTHLAFMSLPGPADVVVAANAVLVALPVEGLRSLNVSNPAAPVQVGYYATVGDARGITIDRDYAYLTRDHYGYGMLSIVDISDPGNPLSVSVYPSPIGQAKTTAQSAPHGDAGGQGSYVYLVDNYGFSVLNIANPVQPSLIAFYDTPGLAYDLAISGTKAYLNEYVNNRSALRILDITDPYSPTAIGFTYTSGVNWAEVVTVIGHYAYLTYKSAPGLVSVVDVGDPHAPVEVSTIPVAGWASGLDVVGSYLYIANTDAGIQIVDISNPLTPTTRGFACTSGCNVWDVAVAGQYAYIATTSGVLVFDASNPLTPTAVASYADSEYFKRLAVIDRYVYVADWSSGMVVLWFAPPATATLDTSGGTLLSNIDQTTYAFPSGVFTDTVVITHTPRYPGNLPSTGDLIGIDHFFEVTAVYSSTGLPAQPTQPYTLTVQYTDQEKGPAIEDTLALYSWDGNQWVKELSSVVDAGNNTVIATPNHFSVWAVLGETNRLFLPLLRKTL